jgi:hypothetical protein
VATFGKVARAGVQGEERELDELGDMAGMAMP